MIVPSGWPGLFTGVAVAFLGLFLCGCHACYLHSLVIEIPLLVLTPLLACAWVAKALTTSRAWSRFVVAAGMALAMFLAYETWLHSPWFPRMLLSRQTIEAEARIKQHREARIRQHRERMVGPSSDGDATPQAAPDK